MIIPPRARTGSDPASRRTVTAIAKLRAPAVFLAGIRPQIEAREEWVTENVIP
jgi:hypothetical protein